MRDVRSVVIDCKEHLLGRLAAVVAKQLLEGVKIALVRCEDIRIGGRLRTNKLKFEAFLRKHSNTNPRKHSHIHYRTPGMIVWRTIRGMIPHRTPHGAAAMENLRVFEGVPNEMQKRKKVVLPQAIHVLHLRPTTPVTRLGDLASRVGWKHDALVQRLEATRRVESASWYEGRKAEKTAWEDAKLEAMKSLPQEDQQIIREAGIV